jgi:GTP-binding protein
VKILSADFIIGAASPSQFPTDGLPQIAFAGRSNVGKSTLLNALMGRKKLVKTSARPGKTKEINFFLVNNAFYMVDLPGVGYAKLPKSDRERISRLLQRFLTGSPSLRGVVYLVDAQTGGTALDIETFNNLRELTVPALAIATKTDRLNAKEKREGLAHIAQVLELEQLPLCCSGKTGVGIEELWGELLQVVTEAP